METVVPGKSGRVWSSRALLILGFGGLLALMASAGFDAFTAVRGIQASNAEIRRDFLARNRALDQIRSDLYLSGTYVRDYLLEPEPGNAHNHRDSLIRLRKEMSAALAGYRRLLSHEEKAPFGTLANSLNAYWKVLEPVFGWDAEQRRQRGYVFIRDEIFPRRAAMLRIADQIGAINESQLSAGNRRAAEIFNSLKRRLLITLALTVSLGTLLASFSISRILGLEREAELRFQEIATARAELQRLSASLVAAQENERRSISRELHDEVGQALTAVLVELGNLSAAIRATAEPALNERVEGVKRLVENCVSVVRNMALLLRPSMLDDFGLVPALEWQAREVSKRTGLRVKVAAEQVSEDLPEDYRTCIYRVVQEALHNSSRHAEAQLVRITVRQEPERILITIQDDGKGFDPAHARGLGLIGVAERVHNLGGDFRVESAPGRGALLAIILPLEHAEEEKTQAVS